MTEKLIREWRERYRHMDEISFDNRQMESQSLSLAWCVWDYPRDTSCESLISQENRPSGKETGRGVTISIKH
jgi:hypothetical protein